VGRRRWVAGLRGGAIDDVLLLGQRQAALVENFMPHEHEDQVAAAACLVRHRLDARDAVHLVTECQRVVGLPLQAPPRPHAPRQRHGRQKAAAARMPVGADAALAHLRQEVKPMP